MQEVPPTIQTSIPGQLSEIDQSHLKILSALHYVWGALGCIGVCGGLFYIAMGIAFASGAMEGTAPTSPGDPPTGVIGGVMIVLGLGILALCLTLVILNFMAAGGLANGRRRTLCQVISAINCISIPFGTLLGIFTLLVLARPSVAAYFNRPAGAGELDAGVGRP